MKALIITVESHGSDMTLEFDTYKELVIWFATHRELITDKELDEIILELTEAAKDK